MVADATTAIARPRLAAELERKEHSLTKAAPPSLKAPPISGQRELIDGGRYVAGGEICDETAICTDRANTFLCITSGETRPPSRKVSTKMTSRTPCITMPPTRDKLPCTTFARSKGCSRFAQPPRTTVHKVPATNPQLVDHAEI